MESVYQKSPAALNETYPVKRETVWVGYSFFKQKVVATTVCVTRNRPLVMGHGLELLNSCCPLNCVLAASGCAAF